MKKRIVSVICVLALLLACSGQISLPAKAAAGSFYAGFSRVDINPYIDPTLTGEALVATDNIMQLPLRGVGDVWNRLSNKGLVDDNGDGKVDEEDGLAVTCIAVSDADGNTVLFLTIDLIGGDLIDEIRQEICSRVDAALASGELTNVKLELESIHYAGTHTHEAPDTTVYNANGKTGTNNDGVSLDEINTNLGIWIDRTVEDAGDAAIAALKDRAAATITKDALSAKDATAKAVQGKIMNSVRHYWAEDKGCVAGDNFNSRGSDPKQVTEVNDTMYLLKFDFPEGDKLPIILANWRAHPSLNNGDDFPNSGRNAISSDYPNSFRHTLEYNGTVSEDGTVKFKENQVYRVAFFNGEGGNVNPRGREVEDGEIVGIWIDNLASANNDSRGNAYGRVLAAMARDCLSTSANREEARYGQVRSIQYIYNSTRRSTGITAIAYEAAVQYKAEAATKTMSHPWSYTNAAGETFVIGSKFHANNITSYWESRFQAPKNDLVDMELDAIMLGPDVAIVTAPGEPFDYYYNEDGSNAWHNLMDETYGTPLVLGYCNGAKGYIPNSKAYDYNEGSTKWQIGSYESRITPYEKGSGEHMIQLFGVMLEGLKNGTSTERSSYCQHCKTDVVWKAYNGAKTLYEGHYYLLEDTMAPQIKIAPGEMVCFDLNGKTVKGATRAFYTESKGNATLNLMDTTPGQAGAALGRAGAIGAAAGYGGGGILVDRGNTFNFYSGNLGTYDAPYYSVRQGGVLRNSGTVNMYGGTVLGGTAASFQGDYVTSSAAMKSVTAEGKGATVSNAGTFNMYGGRIEAGDMVQITGLATTLPNGSYVYSETRTPVEAKTYCVHTTGKFTLGGTAVVDDLCVEDTAGNLFVVDNKTAPFTGYVQLSFYEELSGVNSMVGTTADSAPLIDGTVTLSNGMGIAQNGTSLTTALGEIYLKDSLGESYHSTLSGAYAAYLKRNAADGVIQLQKDTDDDITITKDIAIDLNGFYVTGAITVADGATLYGKDTQTDDYTVDDEFAYGQMTKVTTEGSGTVIGKDGYLKITEKSGISFHKVDLKIDRMALRPSSVGVYYHSPFKGDEVVAEHTKSFGISLSVESAGAAQAMTPGTYTVYTDFVPGAAGNEVASTMVSSIMKTSNTAAVNAANAETVIYGCAYLQTEDGFVFGAPVAMSLRQQMEAVDDIWRTLTEKQRDYVLSIRYRYSSVVESWDVPNILS